MVELNKYNDSIIELYKQGFTRTYIGELLYKKINTRLKQFNQKSNGDLEGLGTRVMPLARVARKNQNFHS